MICRIGPMPEASKKNRIDSLDKFKKIAFPGNLVFYRDEYVVFLNKPEYFSKWNTYQIVGYSLTFKQIVFVYFPKGENMILPYFNLYSLV